MFSQWGKSYKGTSKDKPILKILWTTLPKYLCCKVWLAHNKAIFKHELGNPTLVAAKAKGLLAKYIISKGIQLNIKQILSEDKQESYHQFYLIPQSIGLRMYNFITRPNL
jgi:hypothetical protein